MNPLIKSKFVEIAQLMRFAAISNFISQCIDMLDVFNQPFIYWTILSSAVPMICSFFLFLAARNQQYYMILGYEKQFTEGLAQEVDFWRWGSIAFTIVLFVLFIITVLCFVLNGFVHGLTNTPLNR